MFKPVSGEELSNYDPETRALFSRREANPQTTFELMNIPRRARNHLPIFLDKEKNPRFVALENEHNNFWWKFMLGFGFFGNPSARLTFSQLSPAMSSQRSTTLTVS